MSLHVCWHLAIVLMSMMVGWRTTVALDLNVEIQILHENTVTLLSNVYTLARSLHSLVQNLNERLAERLAEVSPLSKANVQIALATFTDKPIPCRGLSTKWGNGAVWTEFTDYCFLSHTTPSTNITRMVSILNQIFNREETAYGGDARTNALEALIYAATENGSIESSLTTSLPSAAATENSKTVRITWLLTPHLPHLEGDGWTAVHDVWNADRTYPTMLGHNTSIGGFGSHTFIRKDCVAYRYNDLSEYEDLADLNYLRDHNVTLTPSQQSRWQTLNALYGPEHWPEDTWIPVHPGSTSSSCQNVEYPSPEVVGAVLKQAGMTPLVFIQEATNYDRDHTLLCAEIGLKAGVECVLQLWQSYLARVGRGVAIIVPYTTYISSIVNETLALIELALAEDIPTPAPSTSTFYFTSTSTSLTTITSPSSSSPASSSLPEIPSLTTETETLTPFVAGPVSDTLGSTPMLSSTKIIALASLCGSAFVGIVGYSAHKMVKSYRETDRWEPPPFGTTFTPSLDSFTRDHVDYVSEDLFR